MGAGCVILVPCGKGEVFWVMVLCCGRMKEVGISLVEVGRVEGTLDILA